MEQLVDVALNAKELRKQAKNMLEEADKIEHRSVQTEQVVDAVFVLGSLREQLIGAGFEPHEAFELVRQFVVNGGIK